MSFQDWLTAMKKRARAIDADPELNSTLKEKMLHLGLTRFDLWEASQPAEEAKATSPQERKTENGATREITRNQLTAVKKHLAGSKGSKIWNYIHSLDKNGPEELTLQEASHILDFAFGKVVSL